MLKRLKINKEFMQNFHKQFYTSGVGAKKSYAFS